MSGWIAMHRGEEAETLQERHPTAFLLLCQIGRRARWKRESCPITGLSFGQAMIGDWKRAGLQSEKSYRHAMGVLKRAGLVTFKGANKGTVATLVSTAIFTIEADATGEQRDEQGGGQGGTVKGERRGGQGATKNKENKEQDVEKQEESERARGEDPLANTARRIVETYPRRERVADALGIVLGHLKAGEDASAMLAGTKAAAMAIAQAPSGHLNRFIPSAVSFFQSMRWQDDPATLFRAPEANGGKGPLSDDELKQQLGARADLSFDY